MTSRESCPLKFALGRNRNEAKERFLGASLKLHEANRRGLESSEDPAREGCFASVIPEILDIESNRFSGGDMRDMLEVALIEPHIHVVELLQGGVHDHHVRINIEDLCVEHSRLREFERIRPRRLGGVAADAGAATLQGAYEQARKECRDTRWEGGTNHALEVYLVRALRQCDNA